MAAMFAGKTANGMGAKSLSISFKLPKRSNSSSVPSVRLTSKDLRSRCARAICAEKCWEIKALILSGSDCGAMMRSPKAAKTDKITIARAFFTSFFLIYEIFAKFLA